LSMSGSHPHVATLDAGSSKSFRDATEFIRLQVSTQPREIIYNYVVAPSALSAGDMSFHGGRAWQLLSNPTIARDTTPEILSPVFVTSYGADDHVLCGRIAPHIPSLEFQRYSRLPRHATALRSRKLRNMRRPCSG
jgi:hypothetical protein